MKKDETGKDNVTRENNLEPEFIKSLASHGLTGEELKKIVESFRFRWWRRDEDGARKELP